MIRLYLLLGIFAGAIVMILLSCGHHQTVEPTEIVDTVMYPDVKPPKAPK